MALWLTTALVVATAESTGVRLGAIMLWGFVGVLWLGRVAVELRPRAPRGLTFMSLVAGCVAFLVGLRSLQIEPASRYFPTHFIAWTAPVVGVVFVAWVWVALRSSGTSVAR